MKGDGCQDASVLFFICAIGPYNVADGGAQRTVQCERGLPRTRFFFLRPLKIRGFGARRFRRTVCGRTENIVSSLPISRR